MECISDLGWPFPRVQQWTNREGKAAPSWRARPRPSGAAETLPMTVTPKEGAALIFFQSGVEKLPGRAGGGLNPQPQVGRLGPFNGGDRGERLSLSSTEY